MIDNIDIFENFLSVEECNFILNKCKENLTLANAEVYGDDSIIITKDKKSITLSLKANDFEIISNY